MSQSQAHRHLERLLATALTSADPVAALQQAAQDPALTEELRQALRCVDPDGVRTSALLVANLRFERLLRGCPEAEEWFDRDPADFTASFRRYHAEVPPRAFFPPQEAKLFLAWRRER